MNRKIIKFDDNEIEKYKLHQHKIPISINNTDFNKIVVSNEISFGKRDFKFFIGYKDVKKLDLMHILSTNECIQKKFGCMF